MPDVPASRADDVVVDVDGGVADVLLNRPDAANGMDLPFLRALYGALLQVHGNPRVRCVLLTGAGRNFCAGGDVGDFASKGEALPDYLREADTGGPEEERAHQPEPSTASGVPDIVLTGQSA